MLKTSIHKKCRKIKNRNKRKICMLFLSDCEKETWRHEKQPAVCRNWLSECIQVLCCHLLCGCGFPDFKAAKTVVK